MKFIEVLIVMNQGVFSQELIKKTKNRIEFAHLVLCFQYVLVIFVLVMLLF